MSIGHHIRDRAHIMQRSRNHRTGDQEERQDYINMDESEYCPVFHLSKPSCRFPPFPWLSLFFLTQVMQPPLMMSGGERHPASGRSEDWNTGVTTAAAAAGLKGLVLRSRARRILPPDSPADMTGECRADLVGGATWSPPSLPTRSCKS